MWFVGRKIQCLFGEYPKQLEMHIHGRHDMTGFFLGHLTKMFKRPNPGKLLKKLVKALNEAINENRT